MAIMWIFTIGFILCLGLAGGGLIYYIRTALDPEDSITVDQLPGAEK